MEIVYGDQDLIEKLDTVPKRDLVDRFETEINSFEPDLVLIPSGEDYDQDHVATFETAVAALRPIAPVFGKWLVPEVLVYESPKIMWWVDSDSPPGSVRRHLERARPQTCRHRCLRHQARPSPHIPQLGVG